MDQAVTHIMAIRHGETAWNVGGRLQGQLDIELNARGEEQARLLADFLSQEHVDAVYSSDLLRASHTAGVIAKGRGLEVCQIKGLRERCFGYYQGKTFAQIQEMSPGDAQHWQARAPDFIPGGTGESLTVFQARVLAAFNNLAARHLSQTVVVVTHGGVLDILYRYASQLDLRAPRTWQIDNTSLSKLLWAAGSVRIVSWANTEHLKAQKSEGLCKGVSSTLADL